MKKDTTTDLELLNRLDKAEMLELLIFNKRLIERLQKRYIIPNYEMLEEMREIKKGELL